MILLVLTMAVMSALLRGRKKNYQLVTYASGGYSNAAVTYKTPQLIATATPILSVFFICSPQMSFHVRRARAMSIVAK